MWIIQVYIREESAECSKIGVSEERAAEKHECVSLYMT